MIEKDGSPVQAFLKLLLSMLQLLGISAIIRASSSLSISSQFCRFLIYADVAGWYPLGAVEESDDDV